MEINTFALQQLLAGEDIFLVKDLSELKLLVDIEV